MAQLKFKDQIIEVSAGTSVLETLLDHGQDIPNSCRAGACQSCVMQVTRGSIPEQAQRGLKESHKARGLFLACSCHPEEDIDICLPDADQLTIPARVHKVIKLSDDIIELQIRTAEIFDFHAGQYVTLWRNEHLARSYSLVSIPQSDNVLRFHIKRIPDGEFSNWVHNELQEGDTLFVQGPAGDCFYVPGSAQQDLLLVGTGTGLAPLVGIIQDAIKNRHTGNIHLIHGALHVSGLYYHNELMKLAGAHDNLHYHPCVLNKENGMPAEIQQASVNDLVTQVVEKPVEWKAYLCGDPELVTKLRKQIFLAGCDMKNIYADPFYPSNHEQNK